MESSGRERLATSQMDGTASLSLGPAAQIATFFPGDKDVCGVYIARPQHAPHPAE